MCNLYSMTRAPEAVLHLFRVGHNRAAPIERTRSSPVARRRWCARPTTASAIINLNWGFVLLQKGLAPRRVTNVRDDKILTSKF